MLTRGTLTIEFADIAGLIAQLRDILGNEPMPRRLCTCGERPSDAASLERLEPVDVLQAKAARDERIYGTETEKAEPSKPDVVVTETAKSAESVTEKPVEPVAEKPAEQPQPVNTGEPSNGTPWASAEQLDAAPYAQLLAFCDQHPDVGIIADKCKQEAFFRAYVAVKIKAFLQL